MCIGVGIFDHFALKRFQKNVYTERKCFHVIYIQPLGLNQAVWGKLYGE
jgi:hypothetical protein